ncbi:alanine/glycine:cation symporter family protein [Okeania sp.]|uniref:alanine/glycine:cation symporter family protein n=1 Tax=Okeania sp. TaxID=3100323 RepID=UPI002B4B3A18|nr:alanine/glycine:cation symporter family protein [Okeania sp.]MEB3339533.1 alanine/glycine:cation symporter family protein [Okeania sp.]
MLIFKLIPTVALAIELETAYNFINSIDQIFSSCVKVIFSILFFSIGGFPLIVLWLIIGAIFFTIKMKFINIRAFKHAIDILRGEYDDPEDEGEVTHFQALATALSGTVGLGSIAGVAIAISIGGPGAAFWMTIAGFFGMTTKFVECTLAQKYRIVKPDGTISGGPMRYLSAGLAEMGYGILGRVLAVLFSVFCVLAAFGGANMFQANQSYGAISSVLPGLPSWLYGLVLVVLVGLVILGGIQRIGAVAGTLVPVMCLIYFLVALFILLNNITEIPRAIATIISGAFAPEAVEGGFIGVIIQGFQRSAFSNEAGVGSAAIAHSAAKSDEPIREGLVALLEPSIDTILVCNMTALVIVISQVYNAEEFAALRSANKGAELTAAAFGSVVTWFPTLLAIAVFCFAFSTMISWSYYGERCWDYLSGGKGLIIYKILFLIATFIGSVSNPSSVINFSDATLMSMAFPNILGGYFLCGQVAKDLQNYMDRLRKGEMIAFGVGD